MIAVLKSAFDKLKNFFNKGSEYYLTVYLIINVIWIFLGMFSCNYFRFSYQNLSTSYILFLIFNFIVILFLKIFKKSKFDKIDLCIILLFIFGIISTIFAHDVSVALFGCWKRFEGVFQLFYYYSLMYICSYISNNKYRNVIVNFILISGLINSFVCFLQVFNILKFIPINMRGVSHGQGLITHSNFFGSYMVLCMGLSLGKFLYSSKDLKNYIYLVLFLIYYSAMLICNTLSAVVGLMFICLFIFIYFIYSIVKKKINKYDIIRYIVLLVLSIAISICMVLTDKTVLNKDVKKLSMETSEIAKGNFKDSYGTSRMFVWKNTLKVVPKHLLHGVGVDNFYDAFDTPLFRFIKGGDAIEYYDKAHNEYLQKLVTEGIFSLITYLSMLFIIFINSIKKVFKDNESIVIALFLAFIGYLVQAFFNISVIEVAPLFWIICGLLYERKSLK